ncbi:MAG: bifunctional metallophosphatase/5'-nucleotidase [Bacteroidales bacterium]|nr:bifunctional metallophosphatase/5'-nucleotidase [Bacteroidales bacterium]MBR5081613.1 bifunctional metallophosphatase/5'-nucleotidase [Bacteroidales bacterium]
MNKKKLLLVLALVAVVLFLVLRNKSDDASETKETKESPASTTQGETEIAILSVNDMHANIDLFPKFATMVDSLRAIYPDMLLFSAGDNRTGDPVNDQYDPVNYPMIELMNRTGFDLCAVGNHEWDGSIASLQNDIERADFPFLCANVSIPKTNNLDIKPFITMEQQGVKMAVVGMIEIRHDGIPGAHPDKLKGLSFRRPEVVLPEYKYLRNENDVVILLSHCGLEDDLELAQANPWLDAIIGGHSHTLIEHPSETNGVLITQSGSHLKNATLVKLRVKDHKVIGKEAIVLDVNKVRKEKPEIKQLVNEFNDAPALNEPIAIAKTKFETPEELGCLITDALREVSGADFAFQNTGGVRITHLKKGPITVKDVYSIDPFNNEVVVYKMTGAQVKKFILNTYRKNGGYPSYVSGMNYSVSEDGNTVWIKDSGFSTHNVYKVAMNSYMASTVNIESEDEGQSMFMTSEEMMIEFLRKHKEVDYQGVVRTQ